MLGSRAKGALDKASVLTCGLTGILLLPTHVGLNLNRFSPEHNVLSTSVSDRYYYCMLGEVGRASSFNVSFKYQLGSITNPVLEMIRDVLLIFFYCCVCNAQGTPGFQKAFP